MKIQSLLESLQGVKKFHNMDWQQFEGYLKSQNIELLGRGAFGKVFSNPKWNYVIKVFEQDNAYLTFVNYALKNPNKHFPRFLKNPKNIPQFLTRPSNSASHFNIVKIEKLIQIDEDVGKFIAANIQRIAAHYQVDTTNDTDSEIIIEYDILTGGQKQYLSLKKLISNCESEGLDIISIMETYIDLQRLTNRNVIDDMHTGNLMQREDGTVVFIDPFYSMDQKNAENTLFKLMTELDVAREPTLAGPLKKSGNQLGLNLAIQPTQQKIDLGRNRQKIFKPKAQ